MNAQTYMDDADIQEPPETRCCERCGAETACEEIPLMGYSEYLCRKCAAAAYRIGDTI